MFTRVSVSHPGRTLAVFLASLLMPFFLAHPVFALGPLLNQKVVGGYYEEWSIYFAGYNVANLQENGVANKLTHLTYAFGNATSTGCALADTWADYQNPNLPSVTGTPYTGPLFGNFAALRQLKQLHPNLRVEISLQGPSGFSAAASTAASRQAMVANCIDLFIRGNLPSGVSAAGIFDGFDIDWEFPTAADKANVTLLLQEFRRQLDLLGQANQKHYLLTMFGPASQQNLSNLQLAAVASQLDFFNLQGYDFHGTWETSTNHASPIFDDRQDPAASNNYYIDYAVTSYLEAGVPATKLVLGIPTYARGWTGVPGTNLGLYQPSTAAAPFPPSDSIQTPGVITYRTLIGLTGYLPYFDAQRDAAWIYNRATKTFWSYDDPFTVTLKTVYVQTRVLGGLGGAFVYALKDDDANATITKTMAAGLQ